MSAINDAPSESGWFYWPQDGVWRKEPAMTNDDRPVAEQVRLDGPIEWTERVSPPGYVEKLYSLTVDDLLTEWDNPCLVRALLLRLRALLGERDALVKERLEILIGAGELTVERDALRQRVMELEAETAKLANGVISLTADNLQLRAEVARLTARWEALKAWAEERYMDKEYRGLFQDKMRSLESGEKEQP